MSDIEQGTVGVVAVNTTADPRQRNAEQSQSGFGGTVSKEDVVQESESFYHSTAFFFVLKQNAGGNVYIAILLITLALQMIAMIGFMEAQIASTFDANMKAIIDNAFNLIGYFSHDTQTEDSTYIAKTLIRLIPDAIHPDFQSLSGTNWDEITLVFVAFVISLNIMKELEEANITQDFVLVKRRELAPTWSNWLRAWTFLAINALRQYLLGLLLVSATAIVLNGETATNLILNGLALYSILEVDNLVFALMTTTMHLGELEENGKLHHPYSEAWLIRCRSGTMALAYFISIIIPSFAEGLDQTSVTVFFDPDAWFEFAADGRTITMGNEIVEAHDNILNTALLCMAVSLPTAYFLSQGMYFKKFRSKWRWGKQIVRAILRMCWIAVSILTVYYCIRSVLSNIELKTDLKLTEVSEYFDNILSAEGSYCSWAYTYDTTTSSYESYCFCVNDDSLNDTYAYCYKESDGLIECDYYAMPNATAIDASVEV